MWVFRLQLVTHVMMRCFYRHFQILLDALHSWAEPHSPAHAHGGNAGWCLWSYCGLMMYQTRNYLRKIFLSDSAADDVHSHCMNQFFSACTWRTERHCTLTQQLQRERDHDETSSHNCTHGFGCLGSSLVTQEIITSILYKENLWNGILRMLFTIGLPIIIRPTAEKTTIKISFVPSCLFFFSPDCRLN